MLGFLPHCFALLLVCGWAAWGQERQAATLDVCSALTRLDTLDGKQVTIRGLYEWGLESSVLLGERCAGRVAIDGERWPWAIQVTFVATTGTLDAKLDGLSPQRNRVLLTLTGTLLSAQGRTGRLETAGQKRAMGFGHLGGRPALLRVHSIDAIDVATGADRTVD